MKAHQWDLSGVRHMKIEEESEGVETFATSPVLDHTTTERFVEELKKFRIEEVGSSRWMEQHERLERLNQQAHQCAASNTDEYVVEAFLTFRKIETLIHDLLTIEAWKQYVLPELINRLCEKNSMRAYFILYHEATLINLLEILFFHKHVCESVGDKLIEIVDYLARKLTKLNGGYDFRAVELSGRSSKGPQELTEDILTRSPLEELGSHLTDIEFKVCISSVSILRFLCEHADALPLSVISRITDTHDFLVLVIPLIENPPWTRRLDGKWQKLIDQKWTDVAPIDLLKVTKLEGQPWLTLYFLLAKQIIRERYHINGFRKSQILRVRKYLNEVLLDQLPFLADIQVRIYSLFHLDSIYF